MNLTYYVRGTAATGILLSVILLAGNVYAATFSFNSTATSSGGSVGQPQTITTTVLNTGDSYTGAIVDTEIYGPGGTRVFQQAADMGLQTFQSSTTMPFTSLWTPQQSGTYTIKVGVFGSNWTPLFNWNDNAGSIVVGSMGTSTATSTSGTVGDVTICGRPGTNSFNVCYYEGQNRETFKVQRNDPSINFDWGMGSPDAVMMPDHFSARWLGLFDFDNAPYRFTVTTDDGMRLNVDNQDIIDQWHDQAATTYTADKTMTAGQHGVIVSYYENAGNAVAKVSWEKISTTTPSTPQSSTIYYPNAYPSSWYLMPGQHLSMNGTGFAPNETIQITGEGLNITATADGGGNLAATHVTAIPFTWASSQRTFHVKGNTSGTFSTPHPITVNVGTFYPQLTPSIWWIGYNQGMSVAMSGFAPGEQVKVLMNGAVIGQTAADNSGNANLSLTTPNSGGSVTLTAQGLSSGLSTSQTIYLHS